MMEVMEECLILKASSYLSILIRMETPSQAKARRALYTNFACIKSKPYACTASLQAVVGSKAALNNSPFSFRVFHGPFYDMT
jgi:hypothetical protein